MEIILSFLSRKRDYWEILNSRYKHDYLKNCNFVIHYYLDKYKPYDKAGGYGIQEWIGYIGVEAINGSFYNVMGLPVQKLYQELKHF